MSFVNEIDDVVYHLTVLSFVIFLGHYHYHFIIRTIIRFTVISYYILYCKYTIQLSSCKLFTNKLSIYLSIYLSILRSLSYTAKEPDTLFLYNNIIEFQKILKKITLHSYHKFFYTEVLTVMCT